MLLRGPTVIHREFSLRSISIQQLFCGNKKHYRKYSKTSVFHSPKRLNSSKGLPRDSCRDFFKKIICDQTRNFSKDSARYAGTASLKNNFSDLFGNSSRVSPEILQGIFLYIYQGIALKNPQVIISEIRCINYCRNFSRNFIGITAEILLGDIVG